MIPSGADTRLSWNFLLALLIFAGLLRIVLLNGLFGSDDTLYLRRAVEVSSGVWSSADYNGGLRYGFNIPAGFCIYLFGLSSITANMWPLLCSIAEIGAVYLFAHREWGRRAALYSALILTCMPLHIAVATRVNPDPVVSLFLTLSFVFFYFAEQKRDRTLYILTGAAMGMIFWAKELAVVTFLALALYPLVWRKLDKRWAYILVGGIPLLIVHLVLMTVVAGDPLHLFNVVTGQVGRNFIQAKAGEDSPWFYFRYLFVDIRHTWIAPLIATLAVATVGYRYLRLLEVDRAAAYVAFWFISVLMVLSFVPVSITPIRFVLKQSNYLSLFLAPIGLLAGYQISRSPLRVARMMIVLLVTGGMVLGVLEQQAVRVFTSNSKAAAELARVRTEAKFFGSVNNYNIASAYSVLMKDPSLGQRFGSLSEVPHDGQSSYAGATFAVIDKQTMDWGRKAIPFTDIPSCWKEVQVLTP